MDLTRRNLDAAFVGFQTAFNQGRSLYTPMWNRVAMRVPSTTSGEQYDWLGDMPSLREWLGDRVIRQLKDHGFRIVNKSFEATVSVKKERFEDDAIGIYAPMFQELGRSATVHPDQLVFSLLGQGFTQNCYDGQFFFDTDHPVENADGTVSSVSNSGGGAGTAWYLLDMSRAIKPLIYQERKAPNLVRKDQETDDNVFHGRDLLYGVDYRGNVGFGLWQLAYASKQTLNATNYEAARAAMMSLKGDNGLPLGVMPNLLVVPPSLEGPARRLLERDVDAAGATNEWKGTAQLLLAPLLGLGER